MKKKKEQSFSFFNSIKDRYNLAWATKSIRTIWLVSCIRHWLYCQTGSSCDRHQHGVPEKNDKCMMAQNKEATKHTMTAPNTGTRLHLAYITD
jgi:hypothetical protein